jgi:outer membrane protein assembly factor BamB
MASLKKLITAHSALVLIAAVILIIEATPARSQTVPQPSVTPSPPTQTPTPDAAASEHPRGIADLLLVQSGGSRNALYVVDKKSAAIYSRQLDGTERGRISLSEFNVFHNSPQLEEPTGLAYLGGKLLVSDRDEDVLLEIDLNTRAEKVLLRKGEAGGFAAPTSVAASLKGAVAVASTEAGKVWLRQPGALPGAFIATALPAGVGATRLFFIQSDLFVVDEHKLYRLVTTEGGPGAMQRVVTGFTEVEDIVYFGDLLFAFDKTGGWIQPYSPASTSDTAVERTPRVSRITPEGKYELSRLVVTVDRIFAADPHDLSVRIFARPPSVARLRLQGEYFYWLEPFTNAVFRMKRSVLPVLARPERLWSGERFQDASGLAIDDSGTIYIVDRKSPVIYSLTAGGTPNIIYSGKLLEAPSDIAVGDGVLYVLDSGSRKLFSFNLARKEVVEEYSYEQGSVPDRLNYHKGNLLAFATSDNVLDRFVTAGEEQASRGGPNAEWQIASGRGHGTARRAQRFQLSKALTSVVDFDHVENVVYFLDAGQKRLVLIPLTGDEPTSIEYEDLARTPTAVAADEKEMFLVDGYRRRVSRTQALLPIVVEYEGKWTPTKLANLYMYLLDKKVLPKRFVVFAEPTRLETLALEAMPTGEYVMEFRDLFCRMNSALCKTWTASPQIAAGAEIIPAGREVILPDLRIEPYNTQRPITLPLDTEKSYRSAIFKKYVNGPLGELALEFLPDNVNRTELPQRLKDLNPHYKEDITAATAGDFVIPIKAARVYAAAPRIEVLNPQSRLNGILKEDNVTALSPAMPRPQAVPRQSWSNQAAELVAARLTSSPPELDSRCKTLLPGVTSNAMEIVNYCFPNKLLEPDAPPPPQVGIIDNFFNYKHPIFGGDQSTVQVYTDENALVKIDPPNDDRTAEESTTFLEIDHGTHMAALIGAQEQENVMTGFYPRARIQAFPVTTKLSGAMDDYRTLGLFNLSLGEKSATLVKLKQPFVETAPLIKVIKNFPLPLFVVSAGNDNQMIHENTLASFGYLDNVLVVGATNSPVPNPQNHQRAPVTIWVNSKDEGSSFHQELVGVVAPGEGIKSALWNNGYGTADGTSPATAIVTGAAAVLMNVTESAWPAWKIKFRLIASADLWTDKELKQNLFPKVFSGVLDMRRAVLDTGVAVADHQTNGICKGLIPVQALDKTLKIRQSGGQAPLEIKWRHILRIARSGESKYTIIYYEQRRLDEGEGKKGRKNYWLKRVLDVENFDLLDSSNLFQFDVSNPTATCRSGQWNLITLKDFLNTFYPEPDVDTQIPPTP